MRAFVDPLWFDRRGSAAHGLQQYSAVHNVIIRGLGFRAFSRVGERNASGGGCVGAFAPWGAFVVVGLYIVCFDFYRVQWVKNACVV